MSFRVCFWRLSFSIKTVVATTRLKKCISSFSGVNFVDDAVPISAPALEEDTVSPSPQESSPDKKEAPLAQLDSHILSGLIVEKETTDTRTQAEIEGVLQDQDFLNDNPTYNCENEVSKQTALGLTEAVQPEPILDDELRHVPPNSVSYSPKEFENTQKVNESNYATQDWVQGFANQPETDKNFPFMDENLRSNCGSFPQAVTDEHSLYTAVAGVPDVSSAYVSTSASSCIQHQEFQQKLANHISPDNAYTQAVANQPYSGTYSESDNQAQPQSCVSKMGISQSSGVVPVQQQVETSQTSMLSPNEVYQQNLISNSNFSGSVVYSTNSADSCPVPSGSKLAPTVSTQPLNHGYHGNGDVGSSSGYETQSNTSASPYTSPDSIPSLQQGGSDVTTCTSASNSQMEAQYPSSQVQTSLGPLVHHVQSYPQQPPSNPSLMYSASSTDSGKILISV